MQFVRAWCYLLGRFRRRLSSRCAAIPGYAGTLPSSIHSSIGPGAGRPARSRLHKQRPGWLAFRRGLG